VISSIGLLTRDKKTAWRVNGDTNVNISFAVYERPQIRRFVFVSAALMKPAHLLLSRYYEGKFRAERALFENLHGRGAALRPGMVSGTRIASHGLPVPLWAMAAPMKVLFRPVYAVTGLSIVTPPIDVDDLSKAALHVALQAPIGEEAELLGYDELMASAAQWSPLEAIESGRAAADGGAPDRAAPTTADATPKSVPEPKSAP
jgi:hypothetical protein